MWSCVVVVVVIALVFFFLPHIMYGGGGGGAKKTKQRYTLASVRIKPNQESKIRNAATEHRSVAIYISSPNRVGSEGGSKSDDERDSKLEITGTLLLTPKQQLKLNSSPKKGGWIKILLSSSQLAENREYGRGRDENNYVGSLMNDDSSSPKNDDEIPDRDDAADASMMGDDDDKTTTRTENEDNAAVDDGGGAKKGRITAATDSSSSSSKKNKEATRSKPASKKISKSVVEKRRKKKKVVLTDDGDDSDEEHYIYRTEDCRHILMSPESSTSGSGIWLRPFRGVIAPHQKRYMKKYGEGVYLRRNSGGHGALRKVSDGLEFGRF